MHFAWWLPGPLPTPRRTARWAPLRVVQQAFLAVEFLLSNGEDEGDSTVTTHQGFVCSPRAGFDVGLFSHDR